MRNFARWTMFTAATTMAWLVGGFLYLVASRLYLTLQMPTIMLTAMFALAAVSAIAAIGYASKLDREVDAEAAVMAARRARGPAPPRAGQR